jgi:cell wall-associated NlpC family hydrolase
MSGSVAQAKVHHKTHKTSTKTSKVVAKQRAAALTSRSGLTRDAAPVVVGRLGKVTADDVPINAGREQFGRLLSRVSKGAFITVSGQTPDYYAVLMVDGSYGFIAKDKVELQDAEILADESGAANCGAKGEALKERAIDYIKTPYLWGGNTMDGIDCSGFVKAVYEHIGISLPRTAQEQAGVGYDVPLNDVSQWHVGDRLYFQCHHGYIDHTAMYIGNGYFIHSQGGTGVTLTKVNHPYYSSKLVAVRRSSELLTDAQSGAGVVSTPDPESSQAH